MSERVDRVYRQIRDLIQKGYGPGHRLPAERALAAMSDVSFTIVRQALSRMRQEGRVRTVAGRGSFVAEAPRSGGRARRARAIGMLITGPAPQLDRLSGFDGILLRGIENHLAGCGVSLHYVENPSRGPRYTRKTLRPPVEKVPWNEIDGLLVYGVFDSEVMSHPRLRAGPTLVVDQDGTAHGLHSVGFDDRQAGVLAARHLLELDHRRFAMVEETVHFGRGYDKAWLDRRLAFEETVLLDAALIHPDWRMQQSRFDAMSGPNANWIERFERILAWPADQRPTAVFTPSVEVMQGMHAFLLNRGLGVPQHLSMITVASPFDGPPPAPWSADNPPTLVVCDPAALGARSAEIMLDLVAAGPEALETPRLHPVAVTLRKGRTTARPAR